MLTVDRGLSATVAPMAQTQPRPAHASRRAPFSGHVSRTANSARRAAARVARLKAAAAAGAAAGGNHARQAWDAFTDRLVAGSSLPFSILVLPQVLQNVANLSSGNAGALSIISWEGYLSGLLGNTLMCTHFGSRGERSAVNVQLIGMANNLLVLLQVALAGCMPAPVFLAAAATTLVAAALTLGRVSGRVKERSAGAGEESWSVWRVWQLVAGTVGFAIIPQVMSNLLLPDKFGALPGALAAAAMLAAYALCQFLGPGSRKALLLAVPQMPGWAATLLFALSPLPQLVRNFLEPQSLEGLSVGTMLLALTGNVMMLPRALFTRDTVWTAGTSWGSAAGWGQLLSMFLATSPTTGQRYLAAVPFAAVTAVLVLAVAATLANNANAQA